MQTNYELTKNNNNFILIKYPLFNIIPQSQFADNTQQDQQRLAAISAHQLQYGRNGIASVYNRSGTAGGGGGTDGLDGSILIAESISKLADNVGNIADSIREISAAFTTTTQSAFELIRRQSEIIQRLIEK